MKILSKSKYIFLLCLIFASCSKTSFEWNSTRGTSGIRAIVNDSLALQSSTRGWNKTVHSLLSEDDSKGGDNEGLHLINFRKKSPFIWSDTLDYNVDIQGQLSDSVVFGGDLNNEVSFWKIGQKPVTKKIKSWVGGCSPNISKNIAFPNYQIRPWRKGTFLILGTSIASGSDSCQYAVLDTSTGIIEQSQFSNSDAWISGCEDVNYFSGKTICLKSRIEKSRYGVDLLVEGLVVDSLLWDSATWMIKKDLMSWYGKQFIISHPLSNNDGSPNIRGGRLLYTLDTIAMRIRQIEPAIWLTNGPMGFKDSLGNSVVYNESDFNMPLEGNQ